MEQKLKKKKKKNNNDDEQEDHEGRGDGWGENGGK